VRRGECASHGFVLLVVCVCCSHHSPTDSQTEHVVGIDEPPHRLKPLDRLKPRAHAPNMCECACGEDAARMCVCVCVCVCVAVRLRRVDNFACGTHRGVGT